MTGFEDTEGARHPAQNIVYIELEAHRPEIPFSEGPYLPGGVYHH